MARVKRGVESRRKHKKVLKLAKGYRGARSRTFKVAKQAVTRAGQYAYRDRRVKKRDVRSLWIIRITAAVRENGLTYSKFMSALKKLNIDLIKDFQKQVKWLVQLQLNQLVNLLLK